MQGKGKYLVGFLLIIGVLLILMMTVFRSSLQYYVTVNELISNQDAMQNKIIKVAGLAQNIQKDEIHMNYDFIVKERNGSQHIQVHYKGMVPDTFKEGSEVVVTGQLINANTIQANHILAKCASKYEAKLK